MVDGERVSSSSIRVALANRDLERAARLLGRTYAMHGKVIRGEGLGRKLGFPTANMRVHRRVTPLDGIFRRQSARHSCAALPGVASLGTRPTVGGREVLLEAHLFDFDADLYGRWLAVEFVQRLREERKFESLPSHGRADAHRRPTGEDRIGTSDMSAISPRDGRALRPSFR